MTIHLNGEAVDLDAPVPLPRLLERLGIDPRRVAVEKNRTVVRRADYASTMIEDGDEIEIVNFVGGGASPLSGDRRDEDTGHE